jgi:hypothetical protein
MSERMVLPGKDRHEVAYMAVAEADLDGNTLLTFQETADLMRVGRHTLNDWLAVSWGPPCINLSPPGRQRRTLRFIRIEVLRFIEAQKLWEAAA